MRGTIEGLLSPHPIGLTLPGLYRDDWFAQRLCAGLDEVLAAVLSTLDNLPAYLDLATTPEDMLPWLAQWVGMEIDPGADLQRQRELLLRVSDLQIEQGTARGIKHAVEALFGVEAEVVESGGATWSDDPHSPLPGEPVPAVVVVVRRGAGGQDVDVARVEAVVADIKPAHVIHRVDVE